MAIDISPYIGRIKLNLQYIGELAIDFLLTFQNQNPGVSAHDHLTWEDLPSN